MDVDLKWVMKLAVLVISSLAMIGLYGVGCIAVGLLKENPGIVWSGIGVMFIYAVLQITSVIVWKTRVKSKVAIEE